MVMRKFEPVIEFEDVLFLPTFRTPFPGWHFSSSSS